MISLAVKAVDDETQVYGVSAKDLQSDIVIEESAISGSLKNKESYTEFNPGDPSEQSGHYLALSFESEEAEKITTVIVNGKNKEPVDCTQDKYCVYRITNKDTQSIRVTVQKGDQSTTKEYSLTGLTLEE